VRTQLYFFSFYFFFTSQWRKNPESPKRDSCNPMPDNELNLSNQEATVVTHRWWLFFVPKKINHKPNRGTHTHTHKTNKTNPKHTDTASSKHDELLQLQIKLQIPHPVRPNATGPPTSFFLIPMQMPADHHTSSLKFLVKVLPSCQ
jgi:hypothetical protein